jgi:dolichol-phosphate mannosyltransferase
MLSIIIPCYQSAAYLRESLQELQHSFAKKLSRQEVDLIFVDDCSSDQSLNILKNSWTTEKTNVKIITHAANQGAHAACLTGLHHAKGQYFGFLAADLQDPPEVVWELYCKLKDINAPLGVGARLSRPERGLGLMGSKFFHSLMRFIFPSVPSGGFDIIVFNETIRQYLLENYHPYAHLLYQPFHLGYVPLILPYARRERTAGKSSWTFRKKAKLFLGSLAYHGLKKFKSRFFTSQSS